MDTVTAISAENLACVRGGRRLFRGLSLNASAGALFVIEGPNGSGKTSLLRILAGFMAPAEGEVSILAGGEPVIDAEERGKLIGWLGHLDAARPQLTPKEVLLFFARLYGFAAAGLDEALEEAGLYSARDLPCLYLSAGQKRRLALARLKLLLRPVWLLDEPLAFLDASGKALLSRLVGEHCQKGGIAIVASHEAMAGVAGTLRLA